MPTVRIVLAAIVALVLAGCGQEFTPLQRLPAKVWVSNEVGQDHVVAIVESMAFWQEAAPGSLTDYDVADEMPEGQCGIWIEYATKAELGGYWGRTYSWDGCLAVIRIRADQDDDHFAWVVAHEFGHAFLGEEHSDEGNVMAIKSGWGLSLDQVVAVRAKVIEGAQ